MKKMISAVAALLMVSSAFVQAKGSEIVSIDSVMIMQKSVEGKELVAKIQKDIELFQGDIKKAQEELTFAQEALNKQAKALSPEALVEKNEELADKRKNLERDFANKEEKLRETIKRKESVLRQNQLGSIQEVCKENEWPLMVDVNTPGLLYASNTINKTDIVLKAVDEKYQSGKAKTTVKTIKTA